MHTVALRVKNKNRRKRYNKKGHTMDYLKQKLPKYAKHMNKKSSTWSG